MSSVVDVETAYHKSLALIPSGSITDYRRAYLEERCKTGAGVPIVTLSDKSMSDLSWVAGLNPELPILEDHPVANLYTNNKNFVDLTNFTTAGTGGSASTASVVADGTAPIATTNVLNILATAAGSAGANGAMFRLQLAGRVPVTPGRIYTVSAYAKWGAGVLKGCRLNVFWYNAAGTVISTDVSQDKVISAASWTRVVNNDNLAPAGAVAADIRGAIIGPAINDSIRWCGIMAELGNWDETLVGAYE